MSQALRRALRAGLFLKGRRWSFYLPVGEEFDVLPLLNQALHMGKDCFLPITAQRIALEAITRSEERFRALVAGTSDLIVLLGHDLTLRYASPAWERLLGWELALWEGRDPFGLVEAQLLLVRHQQRVADRPSRRGARRRDHHALQRLEFRVRAARDAVHQRRQVDHGWRRDQHRLAFQPHHQLLSCPSIGFAHVVSNFDTIGLRIYRL